MDDSCVWETDLHTALNNVCCNFFYLQLKKLYEESQQKIKKLEVEVSVNKIKLCPNSLRSNEHNINLPSNLVNTNESNKKYDRILKWIL